jgi:deazaflavin-dependent oxidoreductase (nitroreductase family)
VDVGRLVQKVLTRAHVGVYRVTGGRVGHRIGHTESVLLTTTGRRSGSPRVTPLIATPDGDRLLLVASNGGAPRHPDWYLNLVDHPEVEVRRGAATLTMRARTADTTERATLWPLVVANYQGYAGYERKTERQIPLVVCEPT